MDVQHQVACGLFARDRSAIVRRACQHNLMQKDYRLSREGDDLLLPPDCAMVQWNTLRASSSAFGDVGGPVRTFTGRSRPRFEPSVPIVGLRRRDDVLALLHHREDCVLCAGGRRICSIPDEVIAISRTSAI